MVEALLEEAERLVAEGVEARLAGAGDGAGREAEETRIELLGTQGDPNQTAARKAAVAEVAGRAPSR